MIIQENDFLKTYNNMSSLWEDMELPVEYSFDEVANKVITDAANIEQMKKDGNSYTGETIDIDYWCELKQLVDNKSYSFGRAQSYSWHTRFLSFYKAYKAELAILNLFKNDSKLRKAFKNCRFNDLRQDKLRPDTSDAAPDITASDANGIEWGIECKQYTSTSPVHGAKFVVRHTPIKTTNSECEIKVWLVGNKEDFNKVFGVRIPKYAYILEPARQLSSGLGSQPQNLEPLQCTVTGIHVGLDIALGNINKYLRGQGTVKSQTAAQMINKQTKVLNATIKDFGGDPPALSTETTDIENAVQNLKDSADTLKTTIINNN